MVATRVLNRPRSRGATKREIASAKLRRLADRHCLILRRGHWLRKARSYIQRINSQKERVQYLLVAGRKRLFSGHVHIQIDPFS